LGAGLTASPPLDFEPIPKEAKTEDEGSYPVIEGPAEVDLRIPNWAYESPPMYESLLVNSLK
jgi:hypothetical protein